MCIALGWLFGLNRLKLYLAANLVNPLIMPAILFAEVQIGSLAPARPRLSAVDRGGLVDGPLALRRRPAARQHRRRRRRSARWRALRPTPRSAARYRDPEFTRLVRDAADRYLGTSMTAWEFARAKLRNDPVYRAVLTSGWLPTSGVSSTSDAARGCCSRCSRRRGSRRCAGTWPAQLAAGAGLAGAHGHRAAARGCRGWRATRSATRRPSRPATRARPTSAART